MPVPAQGPLADLYLIDASVLIFGVPQGAKRAGTSAWRPKLISQETVGASLLQSPGPD